MLVILHSSRSSLVISVSSPSFALLSLLVQAHDKLKAKNHFGSRAWVGCLSRIKMWMVLNAVVYKMAIEPEEAKTD